MTNVARTGKPVGKAASNDIPWLEADKKHALGIEGGQFVCRNLAIISISWAVPDSLGSKNEQ